MAYSSDYTDTGWPQPPDNFWGGGDASLVPSATPAASQQVFNTASTAAPTSSGNAALWARTGQNPQAFVQALIARDKLAGKQTDPAALNKILGALKEVGVNATLDSRPDQYHKGIMLNGQFVKLLDGNDNWTWLAGGDTQQSGGNQITGLLDPYPGRFNAPDQGAAAQQALSRLPGLPQIDPFHAPDPQSILNDPSYKWRMGQGMQALENSASAKGITRHPNLRQGLIDYGQNFASAENQGIFDRSLSTYKTNVGNQLDVFDRDLTRRLAAEGGADQNYNRAFDQYKQDWQMYSADQQKRLDLLKYQGTNGLTASA